MDHREVNLANSNQPWSRLNKATNKRLGGGGGEKTSDSSQRFENLLKMQWTLSAQIQHRFVVFKLLWPSAPSGSGSVRFSWI